MKLILILLLLSSNLVFSQDCPEGTWNRNQYTGPGGGLYTGPGGGMYTGPGGGLYTGPSQYCGNRPPLSHLRREGIID